MLMIKDTVASLIKEPVPSHRKGINCLAHNILEGALRDIKVQIMAKYVEAVPSWFCSLVLSQDSLDHLDLNKVSSHSHW